MQCLFILLLACKLVCIETSITIDYLHVPDYSNNNF